MDPEKTSFVDTLARLGYPDVDTLVEDDFQWMFDDPNTASFIDWFCQHVNEHNVLEDGEINEYKSLEADGEIVSDTHELKTAMHNLQLTDQRHVPMSQLKADIKSLQDEYKRLDHDQTCLTEQREIISAHHNELQHKLSNTKSIEQRKTQKLIKIVDQIHQHNSKVNECLQKVSKSVTDLTAIYAHSGLRVEEEALERNSMFLSEISLSRYHAMERLFTQKLTEYSKKLFFEGIAGVVGEVEGTHYDILEIHNPDHVLIKGKEENDVKTECKELTELQKIYPVAESQFISSSAKLSGVEAAVDCAQSKVQMLQEKAISRSCDELNKKAASVGSQLKQVRSEIKSMEDTVFPQLIQDTCSTQKTMVLTGDYELKLARQEYFISKQDNIIDQLIHQRSSSEFLLMGLALEEEKHKTMHRMLTALRNILEDILKSFNYRVEVMSQVNLLKDQPKRATIDSRDHTIVRLHKILVDGDSDGSRPQLFSTYASLADSAKQYEERLANMKTTESRQMAQDQNDISMLEKSVEKCLNAVVGKSVVEETGIGADALVTCAAQLTQTLHSLEQSVLEVIKDYKNKKKMLEGDQYLASERELFVHFFTNPDKLLEQVTQLEEQVEVLKHHRMKCD